MSGLAERIAGRPAWLAPVLGALAACGFEPLHFWPLTLLAVAALIEVVRRATSPRSALLVGWLFGVGHFTLGNNWIATAFTYQANMPAWLGWVAVAALSLYLAVYPALAVLVAWALSRKAGAALVPALAATWIVTEWLRAWVFTGFAWNPLGASLLGGFDTPGLAILTPYIGTYGLSGVGVLLAGWLGWSLRLRPGMSGTGRGLRLAGASVPFVLVAAAMHLPLMAVDGPGSLPFTLVQPDISQDRLNDPAWFETNFRKTARLSVPQPGIGQGENRLVLWPESGVPDYLRPGYPAWLYTGNTFASDPGLARARLGRVIGPGSLLLTGAVDLVIRNNEAVAARNVITALDSAGAIRGGYAKAHLVPYGEYLALRWLLEPLGATRLVAGALDFWPGPGPRTLDLGPWGRAGMQICYEIIFSGQVVDPDNRPDYIFNPSNDAWFGSWGPPQHLAQARLRAIEEGLPVLRATTNGISAVIDAGGVVRQFVPRHHAGRIDGLVPPPRAPTFFARAGNAIPLGVAIGLLLLSLVASRRRRV